jgi:hypothetical protein
MQEKLEAKVMEQYEMHQVARTQLKCANCEIAVHWLPMLVDGKPYCCAGCADGGPCTCDYSRLPGVRERYAIVLHHSQIATYLRR